MLRRKIKIVVVAIAVIGLVNLVNALYWIYSPPVIFDVKGGSLSLNVNNPTPFPSENVTFSGRLTRDGSPVPSAPIHLFRNGSKVAEARTNSSGYYMIFYVLPSFETTWNFTAGFPSS